MLNWWKWVANNNVQSKKQRTGEDKSPQPMLKSGPYPRRLILCMRLVWSSMYHSFAILKKQLKTKFTFISPSAETCLSIEKSNLRHGNSGPLTRRITKKKRLEIGWSVLSQLTYSTDLHQSIIIFLQWSKTLIVINVFELNILMHKEYKRGVTLV